jgi:hypothetical protein
MEIGEPWKPRGQRLPTLLLNIALSGMSHLRVFSAMVSTGITYRKSGSNPRHIARCGHVSNCAWVSRLATWRCNYFAPSLDNDCKQESHQSLKIFFVIQLHPD